MPHAYKVLVILSFMYRRSLCQVDILLLHIAPGFRAGAQSFLGGVMGRGVSASGS